MRSTEMIREIGLLSSGTVSGLIGDGRYAAIDAVQNEWRAWVAGQPDARWESWIDCWHEYNGKNTNNRRTGTDRCKTRRPRPPRSSRPTTSRPG